jgi:hypothetical protein
LKIHTRLTSVRIHTTEQAVSHDEHQESAMSSTKEETKGRAGKRAAWFIVWTAALFMSVPVSARSRDADGSRLQARHVALGDTIKDSLSPPRDREDWRSFRVTEGKSVKLSLSHQPTKGRVTLTLVSSNGGELGRATSREGAASLAQKLKPGVYYVSVASASRVKYSLSVR